MAHDDRGEILRRCAPQNDRQKATNANKTFSIADRWNQCGCLTNRQYWGIFINAVKVGQAVCMQVYGFREMKGCAILRKGPTVCII